MTKARTASWNLGTLKVLIVRHRVKILDGGFVAVLLAAAALVAFEIDIFATEGMVSSRQETLELNELLALVALTLGGVLFYTWRRAREHARENARRLEAEREILTLAMQDPLTGLPNRRQFDEALRSALAALPAEPEAHAVLLLDLNGFKKINDVHGHPVGDQVLIHVGARLMRAVREGDLVARLGGDEFAVLARNVAGAEGATSIALRIIESLSTPVTVDGVRHVVGTAIGVALSPHDGAGADDLLRKADVALYRAKVERVSTVRFFETEMDARLQERESLERALRTAVAEGGFVLRYQPSRRADGQVVAFEAQPHWPRPGGGELDPERFLPIAEEAGLLGALTEQLLTRACADAAAWPGEVRLAFNLPGALLADHAFGLKILKVLADTHLAPRRLDLEIDEGALIREAEHAQALLGPLRRAGVCVVADNFGTGYSDLQNLHRMKLDGVKIDRSYVEAMTHDRQAAVMVRALIGVGQGLDLAITANGVGTPRQQEALAAQGCDLGQGALYGEALAPDAALALVTEARRAGLAG